MFGRARTNMYQGNGMADWHVGAHSLRVGADVRQVRSVFGDFGSAAGNFGFSRPQRFMLDLPPDVSNFQTFGDAAFIGNRTLFHPYVEDKMRFRGMDVELGLGYEYATIPESQERQGALAGLSVPGLITFAEPRTERWNFEPRIGIAWSPSAISHTVVRGGFGLVYDALYTSSSMLSPETAV